MKCPECNKEMRWVGDDFLEEDHIIKEVYDCKNCQIEAIKTLNLAADKGTFVL